MSIKTERQFSETDRMDHLTEMSDVSNLIRPRPPICSGDACSDIEGPSKAGAGQYQSFRLSTTSDQTGPSFILQMLQCFSWSYSYSHRICSTFTLIRPSKTSTCVWFTAQTQQGRTVHQNPRMFLKYEICVHRCRRYQLDRNHSLFLSVSTIPDHVSYSPFHVNTGTSPTRSFLYWEHLFAQALGVPRYTSFCDFLEKNNSIKLKLIIDR